MKSTRQTLSDFLLPGFLSSILLVVGVASASAQKASTVVIHDSTAASAGGENSTSNLRSEIKSALEREKPCVETMDDQDLRDAIQDERERALLEGGDSTEALKAIGEKLGSGVVISVKSLPTGGSAQVSASAFNTKTGQTIAREMGDASSAKQIAENLVRKIGSTLADQCQPHWSGTITYVSRLAQTKTTNDKGAMRAATRNTKRSLTESGEISATIKATLLPPESGQSPGSARARVTNRMRFIMKKDSTTEGELYCRLPGRNPFWKGFNEKYSETSTQLGQGSDTMPVFISIDDDGKYSIHVTAPGGTLYGKIETSRTAATCDETPKDPTSDAKSLPDGRFEATSFEAHGRTTSPKADHLSGSENWPGGYTTVSWNLRLVKPKGK